MFAMHGAQVALNVSHDLIQPEAALLGSEYFRFNEMPVNLALLQNNCGYLGQIITHRSIWGGIPGRDPTGCCTRSKRRQAYLPGSQSVRGHRHVRCCAGAPAAATVHPHAHRHGLIPRVDQQDLLV